MKRKSPKWSEIKAEMDLLAPKPEDYPDPDLDLARFREKLEAAKQEYKEAVRQKALRKAAAKVEAARSKAMQKKAERMQAVLDKLAKKTAALRGSDDPSKSDSSKSDPSESDPPKSGPSKSDSRPDERENEQSS